MVPFDKIINHEHLPVIAAIIAALLITYIYSYIQKYRNVPPGPWGLPLLGYWPLFSSDTGHLQMQELRKKYGEVFSANMTGKLCIFLSSMKMLKEAHISKTEYFGGRSPDFSILTYSFPGGVALANGDSWKVQRKFFHQQFKEFGMMGIKDNFAGALYDTINETVDELRALNGKPIVLAQFLPSKCSAIIRRILFGDQGITELELKEMNDAYGPVLGGTNSKSLLLIGNIPKYLMLPFAPSFWALSRGHKRIVSILKQIIKRHKDSFDETQVLDIIDSFYKEKKDRESRGDPTAEYFTDQALLSSIYQFLTDGILSVAYFILLFLQTVIDHPEEQDKLYEELVEATGPDRQPTIEDKSNLPYTNAFINETVRCSNFFPAFPSLECTKETTLNGYRIPTGALSVINMTAIHHDPQIYKDPFKFDPSRFISAPGKPRADLPIMFGVGKRACLGEPFTMLQVFLFLTTLVKNFRLSGEKAKNLTIQEGATKVIYAHPRNPEVQSK